jgi:hypothetical protein
MMPGGGDAPAFPEFRDGERSMRHLLAVIAGAGLTLFPLAASAQSPSEPPASVKFDAAFAPPEPAPGQGFGTASTPDPWSDERMRTAAPMSPLDISDEPGKVEPAK